MKNKLLVTLSFYTPFMSGLTIAAKRLAELLASNGYEITVLTTQHDKRLVLNEKLNGVSIRRVVYLLKISKGFLMGKYISAVFQELKRNDQVLIHLPQFEGFIVAIIAKLLHKRIICFYHCTVRLQGSIGSLVIEKILHSANILCLALSDAIIATSLDYAQHDPFLKKYKKKITDIYPVINPPLVSENYKAQLARKIPMSKKYIIGFIGRIASEKGIEFLLGAIPYLKKELGNNFIIVLAGPNGVIGEQDYREKINSILSINKGFAIHLGELPDAALGAFYSLLDVFVLPSINQTEAFGMVQVEAMFCGTPVVATDLPGVRVAIQQTGMGEIAKSKDSRDLAEKIKKVLINKSDYTIKQKEVKIIFSQNKILNSYIRLFGSIFKNDYFGVIIN